MSAEEENKDQKPVVRLYIDQSNPAAEQLIQNLENAGWKVKTVRTSVQEPRAVNKLRRETSYGKIRRRFL